MSSDFFIKNMPQLGVTSLHRSVSSAAPMRGNSFMTTPIWRNNSLKNLAIEINGVLEVEKWLPIKGFEGSYEVSNFCRIKSLQRVDCRGQRRPTKILLQSFDSDGYCSTTICLERINYTIKPHRIGAIAFLPNPENLPEVNHLDGVKTNNWVGNFEWSTNKDNIDHAERMGLRDCLKGEGNRGAVLKKEQVLEIYNSPLSYQELSRKFNIGELAICRIKIGKTWRSVTGAKYIQKRPSEPSLSKETVLQIFNDNEGDRHFLGEKYQVPFYWISSIKNGLTYSRITGKTNARKRKK